MYLLAVFYLAERFVYGLVREPDEFSLLPRNGFYVSFILQIVEDAPGTPLCGLARPPRQVLHDFVLRSRTCPEPRQYALQLLGVPCVHLPKSLP